MLAAPAAFVHRWPGRHHPRSLGYQNAMNDPRCSLSALALASGLRMTIKMSTGFAVTHALSSIIILVMIIVKSWEKGDVKWVGFI